MKKTAKRVVSLVLVMLLVMSMGASVLAAGKVTPIKGTQTVYLSSKSTEYSQWVNIALASGTKNFTIKLDTVKVSKGTAKATLEQISKNRNIWSYQEEYRNGSGKWRKISSKSTNCDYSVGLRVQKTGTATVKYKIGSKSYSIKLKVLSYRNPVKSITVTGINGGKNFASLTKNERYATDQTLPKDVSSASVKVTPAKGWKVTWVSLDEYGGNGKYRYISCDEGLTTASLSCGKLSASNNYHVGVEFVNVSNGATMYLWYYINGANAGTGYGEG